MSRWATTTSSRRSTRQSSNRARSAAIGSYAALNSRPIRRSQYGCPAYPDQLNAHFRSPGRTRSSDCDPASRSGSRPRKVAAPRGHRNYQTSGDPRPTVDGRPPQSPWKRSFDYPRVTLARRIRAQRSCRACLGRRPAANAATSVVARGLVGWCAARCAPRRPAVPAGGRRRGFGLRTSIGPSFGYQQ